jgi:hypothetical protein
MNESVPGKRWFPAMPCAVAAEQSTIAPAAMTKATSRSRTRGTLGRCAKAHAKPGCATMKHPCLYVSKTAHTAPTSRCRTVQTRGRNFGGRSKRAGCQLTCAINSAGDTGTPAVSASDTETAGGNGPDREWIAQHWSWKSISPWWWSASGWAVWLDRQI